MPESRDRQRKRHESFTKKHDHLKVWKKTSCCNGCFRSTCQVANNKANSRQKLSTEGRGGQARRQTLRMVGKRWEIEFVALSERSVRFPACSSGRYLCGAYFLLRGNQQKVETDGAFWNVRVRVFTVIVFFVACKAVLACPLHTHTHTRVVFPHDCRTFMLLRETASLFGSPLASVRTITWPRLR